MVEKLFFDALEVSLTTGLAICVVMLIAKLAEKKFSVRWRSWVWLLIAVRLLIPFNVSLPEPPVRFQAPDRDVIVTYYQKEENPADIPVLSEEPEEPVTPEKTETQAAFSEPKTVPMGIEKSRTLKLPEALAIVWVFGAAVCLLWNFGFYAFFRTRTALWNRKPDEKAQEIFDGLCREMGITGVSLYRNRKIENPMMTGFLKPIVLLPDGDFSAEEYRFILCHELTHFLRRDVWYKLVLLVARSLHWFNPAVCWMARKAEDDLEIGCDEWVCAAFGQEERHQYCSMILNAARRQRSGRFLLSTSFYSGKSVLKKRFASILYPKLKQGLPLIVLAVGIIVLCGILVACEPEKIEETQTNESVPFLVATNSEGNQSDKRPVVGEPDEMGYYPAISREDFYHWVTLDTVIKDESLVPLPEGPVMPLLSMPQFEKLLQAEFPEISDWEVIYEETFYTLRVSYDPQNYYEGSVYTPKRFVVLKTSESKEFDRLIVCENEWVALNYNEDFVEPKREMECAFYTGWESELRLGDFSKAEVYETIVINGMNIRFPEENRFIQFTDDNQFIELLDYTYSENPFIYGIDKVSDMHDTMGNKIGSNDYYLLDLLTDGEVKSMRLFAYNFKTKVATPFDVPDSKGNYINRFFLDKTKFILLQEDYGAFFYDLSSQIPTKHYAEALGQDAGKSMSGCNKLVQSKTNKDVFAAAYTNGTSNKIRFMTFNEKGEILSDFRIGLPGMPEGCSTDTIWSMSYHGGIIYFSYHGENSEDGTIHYAVDARADHDHILQKDAW